MNVWRAFESKGDEQRKFCEAADYSDQWFSSKRGTFNVYYVCKGMTAWGPPPAWLSLPCYKMTLSTEWDRLHADPLAEKQRWYCSCSTRYRAGMGVLTEMVNGPGNSAHYALADFPPQGILDAKFMAIEEQFRQCSTPQELLDAIPRAVPLDSKAFLVPTGKRGEYQMNRAMIEGIPKLEWNQLFNLTKVAPKQ